jgi:glycosyltransferase involved in cell wall biosynthesis
MQRLTPVPKVSRTDVRHDVPNRPKVALVHDYLVNRGGAERVFLAITRAFPEAQVYTSLYYQEETFPEFAAVRPHTLPIDRITFLHRHHRLALPILAQSFSNLRIHADIAICSSSGWAHGCFVDGLKVVYCYTPAHWLYETKHYLGHRNPIRNAALSMLRRNLLSWDRRAAASANHYLATSTVIRDRIWAAYGVEAEIVPPPVTLDPGGPMLPVKGLGDDFFLCVARLLPYKNVGDVIAAFATHPHERLVVVGEGPEMSSLRRHTPPNVRLVGTVTDAQLRGLYAASAAVIAAGYEDFGLTPLEAAAFGKPAIVLRWGGYLDTVIDGETGVFFDEPEPQQIKKALVAFRGSQFPSSGLKAHAAGYSEQAFSSRVHSVIERLMSGLRAHRDQSDS